MLKSLVGHNSYWKRYLRRKYPLFTSLPVVDISDISSTIDEEITNYSYLSGAALPTDIALLKILARKFPECMFFEIGTWRGETVSNIAPLTKEAYTLNLSEQQIIELGISEEFVENIGFYSKGIPKIIHLEGDTMNYDFSTLNKKFDLIFIDGDHRHEYIVNDTKKVFEHLVHDQSIVVWHDYGMTPSSIRFEVLAGILDAIPTDLHNHLYHVSNTKCAIFSRESFPTKAFEPLSTPEKSFSISLKMDKSSK